MLPAVVFDLDSTVCDSRPRHHLLPRNNDESTSAAYAEACGQDLPLEGTIAAMRLHWQVATIHLVSDRLITSSAATRDWLERHDCSYDYIRLRSEGEPFDEGVVSYIKELRPVLAYQDWPPLADRIREECGVPVVTVNPGYRFVREEGCLCQACQVGRALRPSR